MAEMTKIPLIEAGVLSAATGMMMFQFLPQEPIPAAALVALGAACCIEHFRSHSKFDVLWSNLNLSAGGCYPILKRKSEKEDCTLYEFTLPAGLDVEDFQANQTAIEQYIGCDVDIEYGFKNLLITVYDCGEKDAYIYEPVKVKSELELIIGYDKHGKLLTADLTQDEPHLFVAGETGSGKSTAIRAMITNLILYCNADIYLCDLKNGVEFSIFRKCRKVIQFARNMDDLKKMLKSITVEMDRRYVLFGDDCPDIREYNKIHKSNKLRRQIFIIDEYATLMADKDLQAYLINLSAKARSAGIHLILATQRPSADVMDSRIKANVTSVLGLKTLDSNNSKIILGHKGLETMRGKGQGMFKRGTKEIVVQCPFISSEDAKRMVEPYYRKDEPKPQKPADTFDCLEGL